MDNKSIFIKKVPENIKLKDSSKYTITCPSCSHERSKGNTRSLQIYRDGDGYVRWQCYHPGCDYNIRHSAPDGDSERISEIKEDELKHILPIPFDATEDPLVKQVIQKASMVHWYKDSEGKQLFALLRYDEPDGRKKFLPLSLLESGDFTLSKAPSVKCLYNTDQLTQHPDKAVIVVEGEKTADVASQMFKNYVVVTWPGGANSVDRGDWSLLEGRKVLIWPDNDDPGKEAATKISKRFHGEIYIAYVNHLPPKADLADDLPKDMIKKAFENKMTIKESTLPHWVTVNDIRKTIKNDAFTMKTGWDSLDKSIALTGMVIIEGRSSHGKSTLMLNMIDNLMKLGQRVHFYSYEMSFNEVVSKLVLLNEKEIYNPIPSENLAIIRDQIYENTSHGFKQIEPYLNKSLFITGELFNIDELTQQLLHPSMRGSVVVIDYIQYIPAPPKNFQNRYSQIKAMVEQLKEITKKNKLIIIIGAQLTESDVPAQDSARESKDILHIADVVLRIWNRKEGNNVKLKWSKNDNSDCDGLLLVRKARFGALKRLFNFNFNKFMKINFVNEDVQHLIEDTETKTTLSIDDEFKNI